MVLNGLLCVLAYVLTAGIDRLFSWQTLQRPIVVSVVTGLLLGDMKTGIMMGASLEAIFMGISAIGGSIPADPTSASIIAVAFTILSGTGVEAGLALAMPIGTIMSAVQEIVKPVLSALAPFWEKMAGQSNVKLYRTEIIIMGLFIDRFAQVLVIFVAIAFGVAGLESFVASMPAWVMSGLSAASGMMTGIGFAILTAMIWNKEIGAFFFAGFVLSKYVGLGSLPIAILATVVAIMYFYNQKKFIDFKKTEASSETKQTNNEGDFF